MSLIQNVSIKGKPLKNCSLSSLSCFCCLSCSLLFLFGYVRVSTCPASRGWWNDKQQFAQRWFSIFSFVVCTHLDPALLLTICFCATTTSDFDLKSHTNYTSKNINIIIKIHLIHVASKCKIFNTVKVLFPQNFSTKFCLEDQITTLK
jgi:hypothetical protein